MANVAWLGSRALAALVGAAAVGCVSAMMITVSHFAACHPGCLDSAPYTTGDHCVTYVTSCGAVAPTLVSIMYFATIVSIALGTLPGLAALTLTPAKHRPWTSLPLLVLTTVIGFGIWFALSGGTSLNAGPGLLILIPSLTGMIVAINIDRVFPRPTRT